MRPSFIQSRYIRQQGFTLTELMIALVLGLLVVLAATVMLVSSRSTYRTQDEGTRIQENARFVLDLTSRIIRLAGNINYGDDTNAPPVYSPADPATYLYTAATPTTPFVSSAAYVRPFIYGINNRPSAPNNSDTLTVRYFGAGRCPTSQLPSPQTLTQAAPPDGRWRCPTAATSPPDPPQPILDCQGLTVPESMNNGVNDDRAVNTFYVARDASDNNEPALYCSNYLDGTNGQALIRGIESFQVLYGVEVYAPGTSAKDVLAKSIDPIGIVYKRADQMVGNNSWGSDWDCIRFVRMAMLIRSATGARTDLDSTTYELFGPNYPSGSDPGTSYPTASLPNSERTRLRRVVSTTVEIRNRIKPWPQLGS